MINVCQSCGQYQADKEVVSPGLARCQHCGFNNSYQALPLFLVGGPSAVGKSTLCQQALVRSMPEAVLLDMDILWNDHFNTPEDGYRGFFETWLRVAKNIHLSGRPAVLFGAGACVPDNIVH